MGHEVFLSSGSILLHGFIHFLLLMLFEAVKEIASYKKVMVTHMLKVQSSIRKTRSIICNAVRNVFRATVWAFGAETAVVRI